jgi:hypothetical protein
LTQLLGDASTGPSNSSKGGVGHTRKMPVDRLGVMAPSDQVARHGSDSRKKLSVQEFSIEKEVPIVGGLGTDFLVVRGVAAPEGNAKRGWTKKETHSETPSRKLA